MFAGLLFRVILKKWNFVAGPIENYLPILVFIAFLLTIFFCLEIQNFIVTAMVTKSFFAHDEDNLGQVEALGLVTKQMFRYHMGSVCFGALTICETLFLKGFVMILVCSS